MTNTSQGLASLCLAMKTLRVTPLSMKRVRVWHSTAGKGTITSECSATSVATRKRETMLYAPVVTAASTSCCSTVIPLGRFFPSSSRNLE